MAIVKQENVSLANLRYFDIWTRRGYQMFLPGEYRVSELKFKMRRWSTGSIPEVIRWEQTKLSADVFKLFEKLIGIDLKTMYAGVWRESEGLIGVHDENLRFFYVYPDGKPVFKERYVDMTEFKDGLAWVNKGNNQWAQIDHQGNIKSKWIDGKELRGF
ncbi:hypothetical protein KKI23_04225 [Patescibacteria group bacterium]|nr:hypothetical protein [Patescibacteria group bacterium]